MSGMWYFLPFVGGRVPHSCCDTLLLHSVDVMYYCSPAACIPAELEAYTATCFD